MGVFKILLGAFILIIVCYAVDRLESKTLIYYSGVFTGYLVIAINKMM